MRLTHSHPLFKRYLPLALAAALAVAGSVALISDTQRTYITLNPSVSQRFVAVPSEGAVVDLCYRLRGVYGVTGVSYRDYSSATGSALVTVFFNPRQTSVQQLRIFMRHTGILWQREMNA